MGRCAKCGCSSHTDIWGFCTGGCAYDDNPPQPSAPEMGTDADEFRRINNLIGMTFPTQSQGMVPWPTWKDLADNIERAISPPQPTAPDLEGMVEELVEHFNCGRHDDEQRDYLRTFAAKVALVYGELFFLKGGTETGQDELLETLSKLRRLAGEGSDE
jgi:hypothetical protein